MCLIFVLLKGGKKGHLDRIRLSGKKPTKIEEKMQQEKWKRRIEYREIQILEQSPGWAAGWINANQEGHVCACVIT